MTYIKKKVLFISSLLVSIFLFLLHGVQSIHTASGAAQNSQELVLSLMDVWTDSLLFRFLCSNIFTRNIYFCFSLLIAASLPVTRTHVTKMPFSCPLSGTICWQNLIKFTSQISLLFALQFKRDLLINTPQHHYFQSVPPLPRKPQINCFQQFHDSWLNYQAKSHGLMQKSLFSGTFFSFLFTPAGFPL